MIAVVVAGLFFVGAAAILAAPFFAFVVACMADDQPVSAPTLGTDRAGGLSKGHPAPRRRERSAAAATAGTVAAKDGNGASHFPGAKA